MGHFYDTLFVPHIDFGTDPGTGEIIVMLAVMILGRICGNIPGE
jgi:hypothetical protein